MKMDHTLVPMLGCALVLLLQGCAVTSHSLGKPALGKSSSSAEMERLIDQPGPIQLETIDSAHWSVSLAGLLNLKSPAAVQAGLTDRDEPIQIYAHILRHPQRGNYLVDTGVSKKLVDNKSFLAAFSLVGGYVGINKIFDNYSAWGGPYAVTHAFTYGGAGVDLNWGGLAIELDCVGGNFPNQIAFPFQVGYLYRFD